MIRKVSVRIPLRQTIFFLNYFFHQLCIFVFRKCISWILSVFFFCINNPSQLIGSFPQHLQVQCQALVFAPTVVVQKLTRIPLEEMLSVQIVVLCWRTRSLCQRFSLRNTQLGHPQLSGSLFPLMVNQKINFNQIPVYSFNGCMAIIFNSPPPPHLDQKSC